MASFENKDEFQIWLERRPESTRHPEAVILAHRTAIRVLPLINGSKKFEDLIQPVLCATLTSRIAVDYPTLDITVGQIAAYSTTAGDDAAFATSCAVYAAAYTTAGFAAVDAVASAASASASAVASAVASATDIWHSLANDASLIQNGVTPKELATSPLWQTSHPNWFKKNRLEFNQKLIQHHMPIWIQWIEDRITGQPLKNLDMELEKLNLPNTTWRGDPKALNQKILEIEMKYLFRSDGPSKDVVKPQSSGGQKYRKSADGKTDLLIEATGINLHGSGFGQALYENLCQQAEDFTQAVNRTDQIPEGVRPKANAYQKALGKSVESISPILVIDGNNLRHMLAENEDMKSGVSMSEPMDSKVEHALKALVETHNALVASDEKLLEIQNSLRNPDFISNGTQNEFEQATDGTEEFSTKNATSTLKEAVWAGATGIATGIPAVAIPGPAGVMAASATAAIMIYTRPWAENTFGNFSVANVRTMLDDLWEIRRQSGEDFTIVDLENALADDDSRLSEMLADPVRRARIHWLLKNRELVGRFTGQTIGDFLTTLNGLVENVNPKT